MNGEPCSVILTQDITVFVNSNCCFQACESHLMKSLWYCFWLAFVEAFLPLLEGKTFFRLFKVALLSKASLSLSHI